MPRVWAILYSFQKAFPTTTIPGHVGQGACSVTGRVGELFCRGSRRAEGGADNLGARTRNREDVRSRIP